MTRRLATEEERIRGCIDALAKFCTVSHNLPDNTKKNFKSLFDSKNYSGLIREVKLYFKLNNPLHISYKRAKVQKEILASLPDRKSQQRLIDEIDSFMSPIINEKVKPMSVILTHPMPKYGSVEFENMPIELNVRWNLRLEGFETFLFCTAHEMSHIVLGATRSDLTTKEKVVDVFAMMNGFAEVLYAVRKNKCRIGYFNDKQFHIAYELIKKKSAEKEGIIHRLKRFFKM